MSINDEKPWILDFSYKLDPIQIDQEERDALMSDLKEEKIGATLKDGSYIGLGRSTRIIANSHYVSPESIEETRRNRALWEEYQFLKKEGQLTTPQEYVEWKKKSVKNMKRFQDSLKEDGDENEKKRTT